METTPSPLDEYQGKFRRDVLHAYLGQSLGVVLVRFRATTPIVPVERQVGEDKRGLSIHFTKS
jgi:hypothetical protein